MKTQNGFTLIEFMVFSIFLIVGIGFLAFVAVAGYSALKGNSNMSVDINGVVTTRCINNYKFIVGADGRTTQFIDENGKAKRC